MKLFRTTAQSLALIFFFVCLTAVGLIHLLPPSSLGSWAEAHIVWVYVAGLFSVAYFLLGALIIKARSRAKPVFRDQGGETWSDSSHSGR